MKINIEFIPNREQRYPTVGDYWRDENGDLQIRVSEMPDLRYQYLVMLHEIVEVLLTEHRGIKEEDISTFDIAFEAERDLGMHSLSDEPGWDPRAPYKDEHAFAEAIERLMAGELNVDWKKYDKIVNEL